jgi:phenylalanyl-tRNA synthetase beta chain
MKIVLSWLENFLAITPGTSLETIEAALIQLGQEVDAIHTSGQSFDNVVIGKILSREQHPNADKLGVCMVDAGEGAPRQIVCGAPNARAGLTVAVALPGAVLPGDFEIKVSKIRDVESKGMLCSQRELGMGNEHNGIWEIEDSNATIGAPLNSILPAPETVLEVALTPNRGDCFSHLGLARELAALGLGTLKPLPSLVPGSSVPGSIKAATTNENCPKFNLLEITGIKNVQSPAHIRAQLEAAGLRPKNALVDATNYTMLALGQPMHAYDAKKLNGKILTATAAKGGEVFEGLNDTKLTLGEGDIIITDEAGIVGLGGILGGEGSAVSDATTDIVLEAAYFNPVRIALSGQRHVLHTDARQRFERGIDPTLGAYALHYCANLITEWAGGTISTPVSAGEGAPKPQAIAYDTTFFSRYIGMDVSADKQIEVLESLGFTISQLAATELSVTPPSYRTYMATPEDLTEEILRVIGYENVAPVLPHGIGGQFEVNGAAITLDRLARRACAATGFLESMTYSFIGDATAQTFANGAQLLSLANPLAQTDMTTMRPSLLPGILHAASKNFANSDATPRLAEVGKVFSVQKGKLTESLMAAGVLVATGARHWKGAEAKPDTFSAKAAALHILNILGAPTESATVEAKAPGVAPTGALPTYYHPGRSGTLAIGPFVLATFGELHPGLRKQYEIPASAGPIAMFELHLEQGPPVVGLALPAGPARPRVRIAPNRNRPTGHRRHPSYQATAAQGRGSLRPLCRRPHRGRQAIARRLPDAPKSRQNPHRRRYHRRPPNRHRGRPVQAERHPPHLEAQVPGRRWGKIPKEFWVPTPTRDLVKLSRASQTSFHPAVPTECQSKEEPPRQPDGSSKNPIFGNEPPSRRNPYRAKALPVNRSPHPKITKKSCLLIPNSSILSPCPPPAKPSYSSPSSPQSSAPAASFWSTASASSPAKCAGGSATPTGASSPSASSASRSPLNALPCALCPCALWPWPASPSRHGNSPPNTAGCLSPQAARRMPPKPSPRPKTCSATSIASKSSPATKKPSPSSASPSQAGTSPPCSPS